MRNLTYHCICDDESIWGVLFPGNSIGTMVINGPLFSDFNGANLIEVDPNAASKLDISGIADVAGTLNLLFDPGNYLLGTTYDILSAGGGIGSSRFDTDRIPLVIGLNF